MTSEGGVTGGEQVISNLEAKYDKLIGRLVEKVNAANEQLAEKIRANLSGAVLNIRSGKLIGTVKAVPAEVTGGIVEGGIVVGGVDAPYGVVHERGGKRNYIITPVNKAYLAFMVDGKQIFTKLVRRQPVPKRAFVEPAKLELQSEIQQSLRSAVEGV